MKLIFLPSFLIVCPTVVLLSACGSKSSTKSDADSGNGVEAKPTAAVGEINAEVFAKSPTLKAQLGAVTETVSKGAASGNMNMESLKPADMQSFGSSTFGLTDENTESASYVQKLKDCIKREPETTEDKDGDGAPAKLTIKYNCSDLAYKFGTDATLSYDYKFSLLGDSTTTDLDDTKKGMLGGYLSEQKDFKAISEFKIKYQGKEALGKSNYTQSFTIKGTPSVEEKKFTQSFEGKFEYTYTPFDTSVFSSTTQGVASVEKTYSGKSQIWNESVLSFEVFPADSMFRNENNTTLFKELNYSGFFKFQNSSTDRTEYVFQYKAEKLVPGSVSCVRKFASGTVTYSAAKGSVVYEYSCDKVVVKIDGKEIDRLN